MEAVKELTKEQIEEAIEKKWCPYCKDEWQSFTAFFPGWQEFCFGEEGNVEWEDTEGDEAIDSVECRNCEEIIPPEIWQKWFK